jgi:hypothetical protein
MPSRRTPDEHGKDLAVLDDELTNPVARLAPGPERVLLIEHLVGDFPVCGRAGKPDFKRPTDRMIDTNREIEGMTHKTNSTLLRSFV